MRTFYLKLIISLSLIMVLFTGCQQADFAVKNQGKYSNYINASKEMRLSELKKSKIDKVNEKNSINFYMCKINKFDFKQIVKAKLTERKSSCLGKNFFVGGLCIVIM